MTQLSETRYEEMKYNRCGKSGLLLPAISLGLWQNFGANRELSDSRKVVLKAFDHGITYFDLANNYGPPPGAAEENFGKILKQELKAYRDELIISTKAGYDMWPGPYGDGGSKKYLIASLDQSLKRLGADYVDIFYSHRYDPDTPLEETMEALDQIRRQGKAIYVGISNYGPEQTRQAAFILKEMGSRCMVNQPSYSMLNRWIEREGLLDVLVEEGMGCVVFSPLEQGMLTDKYLKGIPAESRAGRQEDLNELNPENIKAEIVAKVKKLNDLAGARGQSMVQMALAWVLRDQRVTSAIIGARTVEQLEENIGALRNAEFTPDELQAIENILQGD